MVSEPTAAMTHHIASARMLELPPAVMVRAKAHLLDAIASMVSGASMPAGRAGLAWLELFDKERDGPCSVLGSSRRAGAINASLANGMSAHANETDDSHQPSLSHPGCALGPAVLAVGEEQGSTGLEVLQAFVVGYDIGCRIGRATQSSVRDRRVGTWSSHSVIGTFCAAAASAALSGMDEGDAALVLSYASHLASGVTNWVLDTHHVQKAFVFGGKPASQGVLATTVVRAGWTGVDDVFSGSPNWLQAASRVPEPDLLAQSLGIEFEVMQATIKKYAVGSPAQAAVEAVTQLIAEEHVRVDDVIELTCALPSDSAAVVDARAMPNVNVQYLLAGTLADGGFSMRMAQDEVRASSEAIAAITDRITVIGDESLAGTRAAAVTIALRGRTVSRSVDAVRGTPRNPMSVAEVTAKAVDLMGEALGRRRATELCECVFGIDELASIGELMGFCVA